MSNYAVAPAVRAYQLMAAQPFGLGWAIAEDDGTAFGAPVDVTAVTDVLIVAHLRVARGGTPPAPVNWTEGGGQISRTTVEVGGQTYPYVALAGTALDAGDYDVDLYLVTGGVALSGGVPDWVMSATFQACAA